jgi:TonB family protein
MRAVFALLCLCGLFAGLRAVQEQKKAETVQFDPPTVATSVEALYPLQSVASGTVVLEVVLDDSGAIIDVRVVHGIPSLTEPAERSVRQWKFQPARLNGKRIPSKIAVAFSFVPPNVGPRISTKHQSRGMGARVEPTLINIAK